MFTLHISRLIWEGSSAKSFIMQIPVEFFYFLLFSDFYIISADITFTTFKSFTQHYLKLKKYF